MFGTVFSRFQISVNSSQNTVLPEGLSAVFNIHLNTESLRVDCLLAVISLLVYYGA